MNHSVMREAVEPGDTVHVVTRIGQSGLERRLEAKVLVVMRAAMKVRFTKDGSERTVHFADLEIDESILERARRKPADKAPEPERKPTPAPPRAVAPVVQIRTPVLDPSEVRQVSKTSQLDAWLEMGREVEQELAERIAAITMERRALNAEKAEIEKRENELQVEFGTLTAKKDMITRMVGRT